MSAKSNALEMFKTAKDALLEEFKVKELELANLRKELVKLGVIEGKVGASPVTKSRKTRKGGKRVRLVEADVIKFFGDKELNYKDVAAHFGAGEQTAKKLLDTSKKFASRKKDPKNPKSKKFYKVK